MSQTNPYQLGLSTKRAISIDYRNLEIYAGKYWRASHTFEDVAASATVNIQIKTSGQLLFLTRKSIRVQEGGWTSKVLENPTVTDGTSSVTIINLNRDNPVSNGVFIYSDPSSISGGTTLTDERIYDTGPSNTGSIDDETLDWIFKADADYILQFTNNSANTSDINIILEFKQHQDLT